MSIKFLNPADGTVAPGSGEIKVVICCEQIQGKANQAAQKETIFGPSIARHSSGVLTGLRKRSLDLTTEATVVSERIGEFRDFKLQTLCMRKVFSED